MAQDEALKASPVPPTPEGPVVRANGAVIGLFLCLALSSMGSEASAPDKILSITGLLLLTAVASLLIANAGRLDQLLLRVTSPLPSNTQNNRVPELNP
jgi:hypothetical protein